MTGTQADSRAANSLEASRKRLDVQGLRGIAVLLVVLFHAGLPVPGGFAGVDVFFVISGYVITRMLLREIEATGSLRLANFYARRVRRLLPALAAVLVFVALAALLFQSPLGYQQDTAKTGVGAALFVANAVLFVITGGYFDPAAEGNPLLHTWTLAVEEQFYLVFPLLLLLAWKLRGRLSALRVVVVVALVASFLLCLWMTYSPTLPFGELEYNRRFAFFGSPTRAWEFAAGALIALWEVKLLARLTDRVAVALGVAGAVGLVLTAVLLREDSPFPGYVAVLPVAATVLLIVAGVATTSGITTWLEARWLTWLGDLSYSWYLWHWPLIVFLLAAFPDAPTLAVTAVAAASLLPAWASFRYVERRYRFDGTIVGRRALRVALVCCLVPIVAFAALYGSTRLHGAKIDALAADYALHLDTACQKNMPRDSATRDSCTWTVPESRGEVILLGDSNAGQFAEPVRAAANEAGYDFVLATYGGCLVADVQMVYARPYPTEACSSFADAWSQEIVESRPAAVVVASSSTTYLTSTGARLVDPDGTVATSESEREAAYASGLQRRIATWSNAGVSTLLVHQVPHFDAFDLGACPAVRIYTDLASCGEQIDRAGVEDDLKSSIVAENAAVEGIDRAAALDLTEMVCGPESCGTYRDGRFIYRDGMHLSVPFAEGLTPKFSEALRAVG